MGPTGIDDKSSSSVSMRGVGSIASKINFQFVLIGETNSIRVVRRRKKVARKVARKANIAA